MIHSIGCPHDCVCTNTSKNKLKIKYYINNFLLGHCILCNRTGRDRELLVHFVCWDKLSESEKMEVKDYVKENFKKLSNV